MLCINKESTSHYYGTARNGINMYTDSHTSTHLYTVVKKAEAITVLQYVNEKICDYLLIQKWAYRTPEQKQNSSTDQDHIFMFQAF